MPNLAASSNTCTRKWDQSMSHLDHRPWKNLQRALRSGITSLTHAVGGLAIYSMLRRATRLQEKELREVSHCDRIDQVGEIQSV